MPPIVQGQVFSSLLEFKNALRDWAIERNWTPHILDSDSHRVRAGCRSSPDCPFRIRANYSVKRGDAKVTTCDDNHTCEPFRNSEKAHQDIKRAETGKLKFLLDAVPKLMNVTLDTNVVEIIETVERKYGQKIPTRQAQKVKASLTERVKGPCRHCHQIGHTRKYCSQLRTSAPGPMNYMNNGNAAEGLSNYANGHHDDGTYADGGLDFDSGDERASDPIDYSNGHHPNGQNPAFIPGQPQPVPSITSSQPQQIGVAIDPDLANRLQRPNYGEPPVTIQPVAARNTASTSQPNRAQSGKSTQSARTPQESRLEAARLMQQAARLMQEAARLNSEAARLTASVAGM